METIETSGVEGPMHWWGQRTMLIVRTCTQGWEMDKRCGPDSPSTGFPGPGVTWTPGNPKLLKNSVGKLV